MTCRLETYYERFERPCEIHLRTPKNRLSTRHPPEDTNSQLISQNFTSLTGPFSLQDGASLDANSGGDTQVWRVAVGVLKKPSRTDENGWSPSAGIGQGVEHWPHKKEHVTECYTGPRTGTDSLV